MEIKNKLKFILDNSNNSVLLFEEDKLVFMSKSFYEITGFSEKDFENSTVETFYELIHPDDRAFIKEKFLSNIRKQLQVERHEFRLLTKTGNYIWICNRATRFYDKEVKREYIVLNCQDITESKRNEKLFKERLILDKAISNVSTVLLNNKKNAVDIALENILAISKACRIYIFKNFLDSDNDLCTKQIHEICAEGIEPQIDNPVLQNVSYKNDGFIRWKNTLHRNKMIIGNVRDFPENERNILQPQQIKSILVLPIQANNQWFGFIGFDYTKNEKSWSNWDIELLKIAIEILGAYFQNYNNLMQIEKQNNELKKANKNKDQFIQILAHDLKNPFTSLIWFTKLLDKNIDKFDKEKTKKYVKIINEVSNNTYNLLFDLLLWSKSQLEKISIKPEKINFTELCSEIFRELHHLADEKDIKLNCLVDKETAFFADINILKTILRNLITNAIKFSHKEDVINIDTELIATKTTIIVSDNGIGISKEDIKKIWDNTNLYTTQGTNNEQGTGLGLILCKELIEKHGGKIWVESKVGKGSDFKFIIDN